MYKKIIPVRRLEELEDIPKIHLVVGNPVFDYSGWGLTKYEIAVYKNERNLPKQPHSHKVSMIPTPEKAKIAESSLLTRLAKSDISGDIRTEIKQFNKYGFLVYASIIPDNYQELPNIEAILKNLISERFVLKQIQ